MEQCKRAIEERFYDRTTQVSPAKVSKSQFLTLFGSFIAERRRLLNLTQEEFAARAGLHRSYVSDLERGARNIGTVNLMEIAHALELPAWVLIARAEMNATG